VSHLGRLAPSTPPRPGAIYLAEGLGAFARPGQWIEVDHAGGGIINLDSGARLPLNAPRASGASMMFGSPPAPSDVHVTLPIANFLSGYRQPGQYLLDTVVQMQPVDRSTFSYRKMSAANTYLVSDVRGSALSPPPQIQLTTSISEAKTEDLRVGVFMPYRTVDQADFNFTQASALVAWNAIQLWREYAAFKTSGLLTTSSFWHSSVRVALGATQNWGPPGSEGADSDPIRDLKAARRRKKAIKYFVMCLEQADWFMAHPKVIDHFKAFAPGGTTYGMITAILRSQKDGGEQAQSPLEFAVPGIGMVLVHNGWATTDPSVDPAPFWPIDVVIGVSHSDTMPPNADVCTAVTFRLQNPTDGGTGTPPPGAAEGVPTNNGWRVRTIPLPLIGSGGELLVIDLSERTLPTANDVGAFISGIS
jgi:hypothetical protein